MKLPYFQDPQFVDANGPGGFNAAFGTVSGSISSMASGTWAGPGLISPENMGVTFSGMIATVNLPLPWGLISGDGVIVRAHGIVTNQDTTSYLVNFAPLIPASGSRTAYLVASPTTIQQNPVPIPGPPQGHPSYNPNYVPTVSYATTTYTVALSAVSGVPDNVNNFELFRTTLTTGQSTVAAFDTRGWWRAADREAWPMQVLPSGGLLTVQQAQVMLAPAVSGLTHTLPATSTAGGLTFTMVNPTNGLWTIAALGTDRIIGNTGLNAANIGIPTSGAMTLYANAASGQWSVTAFNAANNTVWTGTNNFSGTVGALTISAVDATGANIRLIGDGATTPSKTIRARGGLLEFMNNAYNTVIATLTDIGNLIIPGTITGGSISASGTISASGAVTAASVSVTGGITANTVNASGAITAASVSATGNVSGANVNAVGAVNASTVAASTGMTTGDPAIGGLVVTALTANGANIRLVGNGATTPNKTLRVTNGVFGITNNAYSAVILSVDDVGNTVAGGDISTGGTITANLVNTNALGVFGTAQIVGGTGSLSVAQNITAGTGISTNTGNVTATNGDVVAGYALRAATGIVTNGGNVNASTGYVRAAYGSLNNPSDGNVCAIRNDFQFSVGTGGYIVFPSGFMIQWGQAGLMGAHGTDYWIYFPIAFPNSVFQTLAVPYDTGPTYLATDQQNRAGFVVHQIYSNHDVGWIAVGY